MTSPLVTSKIARPAVPLFTAYVAQLGEVEKEKGPVNLFPPSAEPPDGKAGEYRWLRSRAMEARKKRSTMAM
ncbi:MAG: hypothetical protein V3R83_05535 [Gammaproteobacteria bacterium]